MNPTFWVWLSVGLLFIIGVLSVTFWSAIKKRNYSLIVVLCFFLSGGSGLIFETIWTRMLSLVFGSTALSISSVLTAFMGGLALGSFIFGKISDKIKNPILLYGVAEGGVGFFGLLIPIIVRDVYPKINIWLWESFTPGYFAFSLLRFLFVLILLIVPTTLMGATLPLLVKHFVNKPTGMKKVGLNVGSLYTLNTLGAVAGTFMAGFVLLPETGLKLTNGIASSINLSLFLLIFLFRKKLLEEREGEEETIIQRYGILHIIIGVFVLLFAWVTLSPSVAINRLFYWLFITMVIVTGSFLILIGYFKKSSFELLEEREVEVYPISKFARYMALVTFTLSGLASMNYQVIWNRALAMVIGSSVYSFTIILLAFLIGIALGSGLYSALSIRIRNPVLHLGIVQAFIGWMALLNYWYMDKLPFWFAKIVVNQIQDFDQHIATVQFFMFLISVLSIFPATFGMGASFPLVVKIWTTGYEKLGRDVGSLYAWNTVGCIIGSFASEFIFVPLFSSLRYKLTDFSFGFGMQDAFLLSVTINFALSFLLVMASPKIKEWQIVRNGVGAFTVVWIIFGNILSPRWNLSHMTLGSFRLSIADSIGEDTIEPDLTFYYDGISTTVSVERWGNHFALKNNGKVDASNGDDMPTQILVAGYPLLFHSKGPKDLEVAVVGFGSGVTIGTAIQFPVKRVDVIELEPSISGPAEGKGETKEEKINYRRERAGARWFLEVNHDPWSSDKVNVINNDGRNFLASTPHKYDIIVSEPSNPWITGVSNLFTVDHFRAALRSLKSDGIFCQWVQLYELSPENIKSIYRTIASVFPYMVVLAADDFSSDTIVLASFQPIEFDLKRLKEALNSSETVREELKRAFIYSPYDILARVIFASREEVLHYSSTYPERERECPKGEENYEYQSVPICKDCPPLGVCSDMSRYCNSDRDCNGKKCYICGVELNTDDNARIEFRAPRDLIGFKRFERYVNSFYESSWPYAQLCKDPFKKGGCLIKGFGGGEEASNHFVEVALAMLSHGRSERVNHYLEMAKRFKYTPLIDEAYKIYNIFQGELEGEEIEPHFSMPILGPQLSKELFNLIATKFNKIIELIKDEKWEEALKTYEEIPQEIRLQSGPELKYLYGYLLFKNAVINNEPSTFKEVAQTLIELERNNPDYVQFHSEIYYYIGRAFYGFLRFTDAVSYIRKYIELRRERLKDRGAEGGVSGEEELRTVGSEEREGEEFLKSLFQYRDE